MDGESSTESVNKRKQIILDCIQVFDFKNALEQSTQLINKRGTIENTFRCGTKILATITTNITKDRDNLINSYPVFKLWHEYCLNYTQKLVSRNNLLYYGIIFTKSLITEKIYNLALNIVDELQEAYTFICDMPPDDDNERYMKFMAPLCYNSSLKKDLINEDPETTMRLYVHGVKFYLKYQSNFFILLDSVRSFEVTFVKYNLVEKFYANFFSFIKTSFNQQQQLRQSKTSNVSQEKDQLLKLNYLAKFHACLYMQYVSICYNSNLSNEKLAVKNENSIIQLYFVNESLFTSMKKLDKEIIVVPKILENLDQILNYLNQYQKKTNNKKPNDILKENSLMEKKLESSINEIFTEIIEKSESNYYQTWILTYLFEILINGNSTIYSDTLANSKFIQQSQIELLIKMSKLHARTIQRLYTVHHQPDRISKNLIIKPLSSFLICEKLVEQSFKITSEKVKWINTEIGTDVCEDLINEHDFYIKWINEHDLITDEELNRVYNVLECQTMRLCSQFYSEEFLLNYIRFQKLSFYISIDRLKFQLESNRLSKFDLSNLKNFKGICENLLLSFRLKEKFSEAFSTIKIVFEFLVKFNLELDELEWVTTLWCKVKRDLWKAKSTEFQKITIAHYMNIKSDRVDKFLLEEIRIYNSFKSSDSNVTMNDEIYYTLEKLENLSNINSLLKCRILLEIAQFTWLNYKESKNKFTLTSEEYISKAQCLLNSHHCLEKNNNKVIMNELTTDFEMVQINENKENKNEIIILSPVKSHHHVTTPVKNVPLSPINSEVNGNTTKKSGKQALNRKRKLQSTKSPMISRNTNSPSLCLPKQQVKCKCVSSKIIQFQLDLFKALNSYAKYRSKMAQLVSSLVQSRSKAKENITTNADQIQVQSMTSSSLICPDLCDETSLKMNDDFMLEMLEVGYKILESIVNDKYSKDDLTKQDRSFKKQFFESIDLLAQLYGFFGLLLKRIKVFNFKLELLKLEFEHNTVVAFADFESLYCNSLLQLMKTYLNANMCNEFVEVLLSDKVNKDKLPIITTTTTKPESNVKKLSKLMRFQDIEEIDKINKILLLKPETLIYYNLLIAHYFMLKHKSEDALKQIKSKILASSILKGKQTAYFYEIKCYLKYLLFIISMSNVGSKNELKLNEIIENETPLSLLEECYTASFSVAKYYLQNSFEPSRTFNDSNNKDPEDSIFFNIGSSECYRILSDSLDMMQETCKYYIEISRYRDALGYIREGLDITQLHFSSRRISLFLLHQINADLIASCLPEATSRFNIVKNLINFNDIELEKNSEIIADDLSGVRNYLYFKNLKKLKEIKSLNDQQHSQNADSPPPLDSIKAIDSTELIEENNTIHSILTSFKTLNDFCINLTIENNFIIYNYLKTICKTNNKEALLFLKKLKELLVKSVDSLPTNSSERWYLAHYYLLIYEFDSNVSNLDQAYSLIRSNPHPILYRRICYHLFENENLNNKLKIEYLLETQAIALRHKACSIQIKNKRKLLIDANHFDKVTKAIVFNVSSGSGLNNINLAESLFDQIEKHLPANFVVVSLVLIDYTDLYVIRIESNTEPFFFKLKYDRKYTDEFKQIITENDRSMRQSDRNIFWTSRSLLNIRLSTFTEEIEKNVLTFAKSLLLGSFKEFSLEKFIENLKTDLKIGALSKMQENLLKIIVLGIEFMNVKEALKKTLKTEFNENTSEKITVYLSDKLNQLTGLKRKHVCLLVDKHLHQIPWESLPSLKQQSITRMPSIHFLLSHLKVNKITIDKEKAFYIVDPGGDLVYTKQKFQTFFEKKKTWKGIVGVAPDETQFKTALTDYELFIYTGHGSGSQYYPSDEVQKLRIQACSILMGCSSGNQYVLGDFEPYGTVLAYIIAGCPCIVGNLWDVTDRDIDRLTEDFLDSWLKDNESTTTTVDNESAICMSLNKARTGCKMTFLNGSAPIIYGLPILFHKNITQE